MAKGIFVAGTDTGIGKTLIAASLAAWLRAQGYRVGVMKPVETGCRERDGMLVPEDALRLQESAGSAEPLDKICPYRFAEPLAPSIAADRAGQTIDIEVLLTRYCEISAPCDLTIVEGAGGLMVPLLPSYTYADFARVLKLPLLVVAANKLGAINHLLLTLEHASCKGLSAVGYVLNHVTKEESPAAKTNREALFGLTGVPCLAELPFVEMSGGWALLPMDLFEKEFDARPVERLIARR